MWERLTFRVIFMVFFELFFVVIIGGGEGRGGEGGGDCQNPGDFDDQELGSWTAKSLLGSVPQTSLSLKSLLTLDIELFGLVWPGATSRTRQGQPAGPGQVQTKPAPNLG